VCVKLGIVCVVCRLTEDLKDRCYTLQLLTETRVPTFFSYSIFETKIQYLLARHSCVEEFLGSRLGVLLNPDPVQTQVFITNLTLKKTNSYLFLFRRRSWAFCGQCAARWRIRSTEKIQTPYLWGSVPGKYLSAPLLDCSVTIATLKGLRSAPSLNICTFPPTPVLGNKVCNTVVELM
jgi:hypothetical protein